MHDLVRALRARHDATMLLVTHDVDEAIGLGDRILVMRGGRIASEQLVGLDPGERSRGTARDEIRMSLLRELGLTAAAA
jgi:sulfonate transport system ATP-binding protein